MKKGLIMELKDDYAIVLNDDGGMERIVIKPQMAVGQKIFYFDEDIVKIAETDSLNHSKFKYSAFMKSFGSIAAVFLIAFTFLFNMNNNKAVAIVSLDINPSIQIEVDNNQNILDVKGMNDDGKNIDFTGIKGLNINDGIKAIRDILVEKQYLKNNRDVLVGFAFVKDGGKAAYEDDIKEAVLSNFDTENVTILKAEDKKDVEQAKEQGISLGRYEASKVVDEETKKKITNAPVKEITDQIKDKENVSYYDAEEDKAKDVTAPKEDKTNSAPVDKPSENNSTNNNKVDATDNNGKKEQESSTNHKTDMDAPSDEIIPAQSEDNKGNADKSEINNGILELEPIKPEEPEADKDQENNQNGEGNAILDPDKNAIENNATSGKLEEDNVQELTPDNTVEGSVKEKVK